MNLRQIQSLAWKSTRISCKRILLVVVGMILITVALIVTRSPVYKTSWTLLLPGTERSTTVNLDNIGEARTTTRNAYGNISLSPKHTYKEIALSQTVLDKAATQFGVPLGAFTKPKIALVQQTSAIRFTLKGANADGLKSRAQVFNQAFHDTLDELRQNEIERQDQGIQKQLNNAKQRLVEAQQRIVDFKAEASLVADDQLPLKVQMLESLQTQLLQGNSELASAERLEDTHTKLLGITAAQAVALRSLAAQPGVMQLVNTLAEVRSDHEQLAATTGPEYPRRKLLLAELNSLRSEITSLKDQHEPLRKLSDNQFISWMSASSPENLTPVINHHSETEGLRAQQAEIEQQIEVLSNSLRAYSRDAAELDSLERDYQIAEAIFSSALTRLDSGKFDIYATYPLTQLLTQPGLRVQRDHLVTKLIIAAMIFITGLLSLLLIIWEMRRQITEGNWQ